ncbi:farnesyl pyrophosphate synthetase [Aspergillus ellipticus CBS 707.79]|uniref:Farnesyl pyrophosphate synthetase n=1 Tax=Aspergillus ellipticus CBS 707.79 TaxID=1448320 RepID=A0A319DDY8_9EURO|nr:farnesyl pyrophosphate synthetase [Aspergillus ellipticus CBS 707.79]
MEAITRVEFEAIHPTIVKDLLQHAADRGLSGKSLQRFKETLEYNTLGGKYNRGMSVPDIGAILIGSPLSPDQRFQASLLGWCIELLQAFFLVTDDMIDGSILRRGKPSWYMKDGIGMLAINDACMLQAGIFILLEKYFRQDHARYSFLTQLFLDASFCTQMGQSIDTVIGSEYLQNYTMEAYRSIIACKTTHYTFYLSVAVSLALCGDPSEENLRTCVDILRPIGEFFQVQDDFFDCYTPPNVSGKVGTDIRCRKCSWLIVTALQNSNPDQKKVLQETYGKDDKAAEDAVREIYSQLHLEERYMRFVTEQKNIIRRKISELDERTGLKKDIFESIFARIENRTM